MNRVHRTSGTTGQFIFTALTKADLDLTHEGGLEAMNGLEWFEGYGSHEAFHHRQIDDREIGVGRQLEKDEGRPLFQLCLQNLRRDIFRKPNTS